MAATKQFLLNYDSNILLPYTTLDCILGKEDDDPNEANLTGISVITNELLKNIEAFVNSDNVEEGQINASKISNAYVLGISTLKEGNNTQVYTKFHELNLASPQHAGQYLGADGLTHDVSFGAKDDNGWYSTSISVSPDSNLYNPIKADVSININISNDCFETSGGQLYSKYSTKSTSSNVSKLARYTLNKIIEDNTEDSSNWDASTGDYFKTVDFGTNVPVQLKNGTLSPIKNDNGLGNDLKPIYINNKGEIKQSVGQVGGVNKPIYMDAGQFIQCTQTVGTSSQPMYYDGSSGFVACSGNAGADNKLGYIEGGIFKTSTSTIGDENRIMYLKDGVFTPSNGSAGLKDKPIYLDNGVFKSITETIGENLIKPIYMHEGVLKAFTKRVSLINSAPVGFNDESDDESSIGAESAQPVYVDSNGIIKPITVTVCSGNSNSLLALEGGTFKKQGGYAGTPTNPVYLSSGTIVKSNASVGNEITPVYLKNGTITACELTPSSITGADSSEGGTLYLQSINGTKMWAAGNRTTAGSFTIDSSTAYYLVGIDPENFGDDSFKRLTGAKRENGTGIYFKNYELFQTSDENLKTFTDEIDINFDNLATIKKGIYHWTDDPNKISDIGIGARSLEALYPEIVDENDGVKTIAYNRLGVIALAAIDKLHLRVKELETEMKELKAEIRALKQGK